jgi:hypothetical protein
VRAMFFSSVVVHYFDISRAGRCSSPCKTNPPLIVDADAVLAPSVTAQSLEAIAGQSR